MQRFALWVVLLAVVTLMVAPASASRANDTDNTKRKLILHGVDCSIDGAAICADAQPVFDEAVAIIEEDERAAVVETDVVDATGEGSDTLSPDAATAVRDYLVSDGIAPQACSIQGTSDNFPPDRRLDLQLSRSAE